MPAEEQQEEQEVKNPMADEEQPTQLASSQSKMILVEASIEGALRSVHRTSCLTHDA